MGCCLVWRGSGRKEKPPDPWEGRWGPGRGEGGMHDGAGRGARILFAIAMHGHIC